MVLHISDFHLSSKHFHHIISYYYLWFALIGAESPEAVRKMLALSDKVRPHNPKHSVPTHHIITPHSPGTRRQPGSPKQKRPPPPPVAVNLSPESSSVLSLSNITHKKPPVTTSTCSNDSNSPTNSVGSSSSANQPCHYETDSGRNSCASSSYESHSPSSISSTSSPPSQKRPETQHSAHTHSHHNSHQQNQINRAYSHFVKQQYQFLCRGQRPPCPPDYHIATQMAQLARKDNHHLHRANSCDGTAGAPRVILNFPQVEDEDENEEFVDGV
ncbi:hypothetical protein LSH36_115g03031 [Paralvinella palmiformis]|uniref:Uncharacterized protein n=1 Tax=Paralvinella palmiformis TaxID=53620 RepID=A0AAD9JZW4_9ANNE|nr:hypothetical protein LSH36_115g03031 [Paralvinella palmiformis]